MVRGEKLAVPVGLLVLSSTAFGLSREAHVAQATASFAFLTLGLFVATLAAAVTRPAQSNERRRRS